MSYKATANIIDGKKIINAGAIISDKEFEALSELQKIRFVKVKSRNIVKEEPAEEKRPTEKWKNDDIKTWMDGKGIEYGSDDTKAELLGKIEEYFGDGN